MVGVLSLVGCCVGLKVFEGLRTGMDVEGRFGYREKGEDGVGGRDGSGAGRLPI